MSENKVLTATIIDVFGVTLNTAYTPYRHETRQIQRMITIGETKKLKSEVDGNNIIPSPYHGLRTVFIGQELSSSGYTWRLFWVVIGNTSMQEQQIQSEYRPEFPTFKPHIIAFEIENGLREK